MASNQVTRVCACGCGRTFTARTADVRRGWARFATKSCKAREQERRTGQYARYVSRQRADNRPPDPFNDDSERYGHIGSFEENS